MTRALLLAEKRVALAMVDARGALADASVGLLVIAMAGSFLAVRRWWGRVLSLLVVVTFLLASFAMYEFISVFDSLYAFSHVGFLGDLTFLGGSARHARHPILLLSMVALAIVGSARARVPGTTWWRWWGVAFAACVFGEVVIPASGERDEWRQRHAIQANLSFVPATVLGTASVGAEVRDVFRADLDGERWLGPLDEQPNVLLILVEAASAAYLPSVAAAEGVQSAIAMPKLDALARRHILFSRVVAHQRQTNRGEYAILCGDYPKLLTDQSKMTEQVYGAAGTCLPAVLRDAGYATAYIQAAPLAFMLKDQFMKKAGFDELIGDRWFEHSYARTDWGVDDRAFFEQALARVVDLQAQDKPFFATLLTVGTHHPFTIPDSPEEEGALRRQQRAFQYADDALADFLSELERREVLRDTVVIITSDESTGLVRAASATHRLLSQSWSFVVVMLPAPKPKRIGTSYGHVDAAVSITDLLGMERQAKRFVGRSWFRNYATSRSLFAGNTYARRVFALDPSGHAVICDESFRRCMRSVPRAAVFGPERQTVSATGRERQLVAEVARLTRSGRADMTQASAMALITEEALLARPSDGKKLAAGGQYLRVLGGTTVRVDFDLKVEGEGAEVAFQQDVFLNGYERFARNDVRLRGGERWRLSYEIGVPQDSSHLVVQLYATAVGSNAATIKFKEARLSMEPRASTKVAVIRDEVSQSPLR